MKKTLTAAALFALPVLAFAQGQTNITSLLTRLSSIINIIIPFIVGLAVLVIIWGVFNFIIGAGDEEKRAQAKSYIIWGVIGVFIMLSIWGLVNVLVNSFQFDSAPGAAPIVNPSTLYPDDVDGVGTEF